MSATTATSDPVERTIDGKKRYFRTITTRQNRAITNTKIVEEIIVYKTVTDSQGRKSFEKDPEATEELINTRKSESPSLVTDIPENGGKSYITVRDGGNDTIYSEVALRKEFAEQGQTSFTTQLNEASAEALSSAFPSTSIESQTSFWAAQLSPDDNVAQYDVDADPPTVNLETIQGPLAPINIDIQPADGGRKTDYEDLFYPLDIVRSSQDRIRFKMRAQSGRSISINPFSGNPFSFGKPTITPITGSVTLPIQGGVQDQNQVDYTESRLNPVTGLMAAAAMDPAGAAKLLLDALKAPAEDIQKAIASPEAQNIINVLRVYLAQSAVGGSGLIPRTTGAILNPNMELLLNSPALRNFQFSFKMSARSAPEATQIKKIIRFFKQGMSVKQSQQTLFVISPNIFNIEYLTGSKTHPSIGQIKPCALTALNTNYTPDGTYMTYDDPSRTMTSYEMNMQFTELEPLTESDYTNVNEGSIGF